MAQWVKNLSAMQKTQEMQVWSLGREDPLKEEMVTHANILAWKNPMDRRAMWLPPRGLQRVRHNWVSTAFKSLLCQLLAVTLGKLPKCSEPPFPHLLNWNTKIGSLKIPWCLLSVYSLSFHLEILLPYPLTLPPGWGFNHLTPGMQTVTRPRRDSEVPGHETSSGWTRDPT